MSLITYWNRNTARHLAVSGRTDRAAVAFSMSKIIAAVRSAVARAGRLFVHAIDALAEARMHRAAIEVELYRDRYKHSSKNDDDLPIVRLVAKSESIERHRAMSRGTDMSITSHPQAAPQVASRPSFGSTGAHKNWMRAARRSVATAKRVYPIILTFAIFGAIVVATIALRFAIWFPRLGH